MTKATTPFKMFYVELPAVKPFTAKTVRCYLDLETGNIFGSKEVVSRFLKKSQVISNSTNVVLDKAQGMLCYYWNKDNKGSVPTAWIRGKVVKRPWVDTGSKVVSKIDFVLL